MSPAILRLGALAVAGSSLALASCGPHGEVPEERAPERARVPLPTAEELSSPDVRVRLEAVRALRSAPAGAAAFVPSLLAALGDADRWVREAAAIALRDLGPEAAPAAAALDARLNDEDEYVRWRVVEALGRLGVAAARSLPALSARSLDGDEVEVVRAASQVSASAIARALEAAGSLPR